jgi:hypothetical protein
MQRAALVALLALAGLDRLLVRLLDLLAPRGAVGVLGLALGGLGVEAGARRQQGGAEDCRNSHESFSFGGFPSQKRSAAPADDTSL